MSLIPAIEAEKEHTVGSDDEFNEGNEGSMRHNAYPVTDSDNEEYSDAHRTVFRAQIIGEESLVVGHVFYDCEDIKSAVLDHALKHGRNIRQNRYDKTKIGFCCIGGNCEWRIWCSIRSHGDRWEVRSYNNKHSCIPNGECDLLKIPVIAKLFMDKIRDETSYYMPMKIEEVIKEKWKLNVSRDQCQKARNMALKWIEEWYDEQFKRLRDYAGELLESNPNTSVDVETFTNAEGLEIFNRFYVCYDVLRRTWNSHCRRLLGMDGCFLKGKMKGMLLVALGRDGENAIYPVAWAVVQKEDTPNWLWFVNKHHNSRGHKSQIMSQSQASQSQGEPSQSQGEPSHSQLANI